MMRTYFLLIILCLSAFAQRVDHKWKYYTAIASTFAIAAAFQKFDYEPLISSDTEKQQFAAKNTIPFGYTAFVAPVIMLAANAGNKKGYYHSLGMMESLIANFGLTTMAKHIFKRERPNNEKDRVSFWSGHSSSSFAGAHYLSLYFADYSGWKRGVSNGIGIALHATAAYIAWTRVEDYQHHFSDILVGAVVGVLVSRTIYKIRNNNKYNVFERRSEQDKNPFVLSFNLNL